MFISINGRLLDTTKIDTARRSGSSVYVYYKDGNSDWIWMGSDREAIAAVEKIADAMNGCRAVVGSTTEERLAAVDAAQKALAEKRVELERQKAVEDSSAAIGALLVGGFCAIADAIANRKAMAADADKKRRR